MQHSHSIRRGRFADAPGASGEVPFGIRAIESGIEVDGVWVSRSNTPASSLAGSPKLRPRDHAPDRASANSDLSHIEIPQPIHRHADTDRPSTGPSKRIRNPPPTSDHQSRGRISYEPRRSSQLRYSSYSSSEDPEAPTALDGRSVVSDRHGKRPEGNHTLPTSLHKRRHADIASKDKDRRAHLNSPRHHLPRLLVNTVILPAAQALLIPRQMASSVLLTIIPQRVRTTTRTNSPTLILQNPPMNRSSTRRVI